MQTLTPLLQPIEEQLSSYRCKDERVVVSSSFQTQSLPLLHLLSEIAPDTPVAFLDTGFHFPETITFRDEVIGRLGLDLIVVNGLATRKDQPNSAGLYAVSETACCNLNKVEPMHTLLADFDVWVSGVRRSQTSTRDSFDVVMPGPVNTERYHPLLTWTDGDIEKYRAEHELPAHPLDARGFSSIGCAPCTRPSEGNDRSGRWSGTEKTECGLHRKDAAQIG